ncbi:hypothetical protein [Actinoplanes auranticolor]|uniref:Uncharacterized protein n=1 Tax=Actinoplanes auranticolor TaxID=47988 RepID=A0A919SSC5_9ACTN|nr:hypothetical protein [Actinoplanes auranticolor]GIM77632.1 hypothetical protein Aau02nite_76920 [Actinoplanes auranticolor]
MDAGVGHVIDLLTASLDEIERCVVFHPGTVASSHTVVLVSGLDGVQVPAALGRYLVGNLAGAVGQDAQLSEFLLARGVDRREEVRRTVTELIGTDNIFATSARQQFRDTRRNAWIGEGVGHALLMLSARRETSCVDGRMCTLSEMHQTVTRQGLDSVGTYVQNEVLGVSIGESKSTASNAADNLGEALKLFVEVEEGIHGPDLRARLSTFRPLLEPHLKEQVKDSLWTENASYLPIVVYRDDYDFTTNRPKFQRMRTPRERRRVIVVQLSNFHAFFDTVADSMRAAVDEVII